MGAYDAISQFYNQSKIDSANAINSQYAPQLADTQTQMDNLPKEYDPLRSAAVVNNALETKRIDEKMAGGGLTNSGTNLTYQTAQSGAYQGQLGGINLKQEADKQNYISRMNTLKGNQAAAISNSNANIGQAQAKSINDYNIEIAKEQAATQAAYIKAQNDWNIANINSNNKAVADQNATNLNDAKSYGVSVKNQYSPKVQGDNNVWTTQPQDINATIADIINAANQNRKDKNWINAAMQSAGVYSQYLKDTTGKAAQTVVNTQQAKVAADTQAKQAQTQHADDILAAREFMVYANTNWKNSGDRDRQRLAYLNRPDVKSALTPADITNFKKWYGLK
jgi:hypothetical protein